LKDLIVTFATGEHIVCEFEHSQEMIKGIQNYENGKREKKRIYRLWALHNH